MIAASGLELRAGAQLLLTGASFQIGPGDKVGLVGRNGAGKTTLARVLAGEAQPAAGTVRRGERIGYLPQDTRSGDLEGLALDRVLSGRGLDELRAGLRAAEQQMSDGAAEPPGRRGTPVRAARGTAGHAGWLRGRGRGLVDRVQPGPAGPGRWPSRWPRCPAGSGAGSSWPGSCSPTRRRCCSTSPPTTWTPTR